MATPHYYVFPFGENADDLTAIPDSAAVDGSVSYEDGWTPPYEYNLVTNPAALPIPRGQMNQLFFDITNNIQEYQQYGTPQWVTGNTVLYPIFSRVYYNNLVYQSLIADNTDTPGTTANWQVVSVGQVINLTSNTTLPSSAYGAQVNCTGGSAFAVTLPTPAAGSYIDFFVNTSSFALVTITPPSGTIQGRASFVLGSMESCRVLSDGTNFFIVNYAMQPASFLVNLLAGQSIPNSSRTKVTFNSAVYDVGSFFDTATNHRYQPLYPGKYCFYFSSQFNVFNDQAVIVNNDIAQNGTDACSLRNNSIDHNSPMCTWASITLPMNGTTDYVEFFISQNDNAARTLLSTSTVTFAGGYRISNF